MGKSGSKVEAGSYTVHKPEYLFRGKSYADWVTDWFNWFLSVDPDAHNAGPVVFLRSFPFPTSNARNSTGLDQLNSTNEMIGQRKGKMYMNNPNVMAGADRLQITEDQAVMFPIINAYYIATEPFADLGYMHSYTGPAIDHGDNPPEAKQIQINKKDFAPGIDMKHFRIVTSVFTAVVPDADYGDSLKDFLEVPIPAGNYPAVVEGYFVLLTFVTSQQREIFTIHSKARGPRASRGPYFAELYYEIEVFEGHKLASTISPARNDGIIANLLDTAEKEKGKVSAFLE